MVSSEATQNRFNLSIVVHAFQQVKYLNPVNVWVMKLPMPWPHWSDSHIRWYALHTCNLQHIAHHSIQMFIGVSGMKWHIFDKSIYSFRPYQRQILRRTLWRHWWRSRCGYWRCLSVDKILGRWRYGTWEDWCGYIWWWSRWRIWNCCIKALETIIRKAWRGKYNKMCESLQWFGSKQISREKISSITYLVCWQSIRIDKLLYQSIYRFRNNINDQLASLCSFRSNSRVLVKKKSSMNEECQKHEPSTRFSILLAFDQSYTKCTLPRIILGRSCEYRAEK